MTKPLINVKKIHKSYNKKPVLTGPSFDILPGTFTTLLGANGSGKSTLLRMIAGAEFPDSGEVYFKDTLAHSWEVPHKKDMFYINENINIESSLTMKEFTEKYREFFPRWHEESFNQMIKDRKLDLNRHYHQYSRGQKMQFNLILALSVKPEVLLLDEITSVMDVYARRYFLGLLHRFCKSGKTVVMTTNIISELQYYTTDLLLLQRGNLKLQGSLESVKGGFVKLRFPYGSDHPLLKRTDICWAGVNGDGSENFLIAKDLADQLQIDEAILDRREITLEDIFIFHYADQEEESHAHAA
ncbi:MAG: ABC transporter ATP-binding protein [Bacteriovoracaceae bacterium]|nr:ABC transporter ATP-binding protein [Bacteriovoracaceae bacterium]